AGGVCGACPVCAELGRLSRAPLQNAEVVEVHMPIRVHVEPQLHSSTEEWFPSHHLLNEKNIVHLIADPRWSQRGISQHVHLTNALFVFVSAPHNDTERIVPSNIESCERGNCTVDGNNCTVRPIDLIGARWQQECAVRVEAWQRVIAWTIRSIGI